MRYGKYKDNNNVFLRIYYKKGEIKNLKRLKLHFLVKNKDKTFS